MIIRYITLIRITIVTSAALTMVFCSIGQPQLKSSKNATVVANNSPPSSALSIAACVNEFSRCKIDATSPMKSGQETKTRQAVAVNHAPSVCQSSHLDTSTYNYDHAIIKVLVQANSTIDGYRETANANGESYIDFNNQLSDLFALFNSQIQEDYSNYISELGTCKTTVSTPQLFQDYD